jgi:RNA polymerase sigma-70 factor (ECF subfamily)
VGFLRTLLQPNESPPEDPGNGDAELVRRARQGDAQAFALLYRRYLDRVYDFAYSRLDSREAAEDATQTIFLKAVTNLPQCRDDTMFAGWLFAIARNVITDSYRSRHVATQPLDTAPDVEDPQATPEDLAIRAEWNRELADLRQRCLNANERDILDLRLQGLTDREIAVALGRGYGAIRTAEYRMVLKLRGCMRESTPMSDSIQRKEAAHVDR